MSVQYYGYERMPKKIYNTLKSEDLIQAKQIKRYTTYIPKTIEKDLKIQEQNKMKNSH